ncbi:AGAP005747-PB-like protein [Anopheles sinensis]|uniref:AGAP005747-PB-like protein n=1 Tax=Anopheles sinensis TaxID=74873 RepID=A0A084WJL2_ANOSI|nr:AGAP005747-PB-like protein [Anopheles sinensis]
MYMKRALAARETLNEVDETHASSSSTTAPIWKHFTSINNGIAAECVYCSRQIAITNGSSSSLEMHLVQEHPNILQHAEQVSSPREAAKESSHKPATKTFGPTSSTMSQTTLRNETEEYSLKSHSHPQDISATLANLYINDRYADVMLLTCNGEENYTIPAHKFILGSSSSYFANIFDKSIVPSNAMTYIVLPPDLTYRSVQVLLQYMYTGESTISNDILNEVLRGGEILQIRGLCANERGQICRTGGNTGESRVGKKNPQNNQPRQNNQKQRTNDTQHTLNVRGGTEKSSSLPSTFQEHHDSTEEFNFINVKMENVEWSDYGTGDSGRSAIDVLPTELNNSELIISESTIKLEGCTAEASRSPTPSTEEPTSHGSLACELCSERFTAPSEFVRHIKVHTDMVQDHPSKRPRQEATSNDETDPLKCALCSTFYPTPAEWILHLQNTHTETELAVSSNRTVSPETRPSLSREDSAGKEAT